MNSVTAYSRHPDESVATFTQSPYDDAPLPLLDDAAWFDIEVTEDIERGKWTRAGNGALQCDAPILTGRPSPSRVHPKGYRPDLPTLSSEAQALAWADRVMREHEKRQAKQTASVAPVSTYGADHSEVRASKPHPRSSYAHLPLGRFTDAQLTRATKEDKAAWEARPLTYLTPLESALWQSQYAGTYNPDMSPATRAKVFAKTYAKTFACMGGPAEQFVVTAPTDAPRVAFVRDAA